MTQRTLNHYEWLASGEEIFPALTAAIQSSRKTIRFEVYIYANDEAGRAFRELLFQARLRGLRVQVLVDAIGSLTLPGNFWEPFVAAGGEVRRVNPDLLDSLGSRDHRKLLVCDEEIAFVGGFNIAAEYQGDGVKSGWFDLGLRVVSPLAVQLAAAFDEMFAHANSPPPRFRRRRNSLKKRDVVTDEGKLLLSGPGWARNPFTRSLHKDLDGAREVQIIVPYFLPTMRLRRELRRVARRGGKVQLILPAKSDVLLSQLAGQSLYRRLMRAGVEIYEYQPQILHAKLIIIDGVVYAGSSNLDPRSLSINYELMLRIENPDLLREAREIFAKTQQLCLRIDKKAWRQSGTWWRRMKQRWAYFSIVRIDPLIARWKLRRKNR
jgi:cardiolipin synthase